MTVATQDTSVPALEAMQSLLDDFCSDQEQWDDEWNELSAAFSEVCEQSLLGRRDDMVNADLTEQRQEFLDRHDQLSSDLSELRRLVDQQVQLFSDYVESGRRPGNKRTRRSRN